MRSKEYYEPEVWDDFEKKSDKEINQIADSKYPDNWEQSYNGSSEGKSIWNKIKRKE